MRVLRPIRQTLGTGAALVGGLLVPLLLLALFIGGISYRKDCLTDDGHVASNWSFTVFAPLPYLFRPSQTGCEVHTGTRVALNAVGIGGFAPPSAERLIDESAKGDANLVYWGRVRLILRDYFASLPSSRTYASADDLLRTTAAKLRALPPTPAFADAHARLVAALDGARRADDLAYRALLHGHRGEAGSALAQVERRMRDAVKGLNAVHARLNRQ